MPLAQVQGARSPLLGLGKAQPSVSVFARQRRANSSGQQLGDRGRTGGRQPYKAGSARAWLTLFCKQCGSVSSFHLHTGRCCFLNAMRSEKTHMDRLGSVPQPQSARASSLVSVDSFADASCATGAYRLTPQTRQGSSPCTSGGLRPSTLFYAHSRPLDYSPTLGV